MTVERLTAIIVVIVAMLVAVAVPVAQLRTTTTSTMCCCPDPSNCHCPAEPAHPAHKGDTPTMRSCHHWTHDSTLPDAPSIAMAARVSVAPVGRVAAAQVWAPNVPHVSPDPARPTAPS